MVVSGPILCTQPAGCPEVSVSVVKSCNSWSVIFAQIAKKSLAESDAAGGSEMFIIGKNFGKDSSVVWKGAGWMRVVEPNKEFLHSVFRPVEPSSTVATVVSFQTHIVCTIPPYDGLEMGTNVAVSVFVKNSDGKSSESHAFLYTRRPSIGKRKLFSSCHSSLLSME